MDRQTGKKKSTPTIYPQPQHFNEDDLVLINEQIQAAAHSPPTTTLNFLKPLEKKSITTNEGKKNLPV